MADYLNCLTSTSTFNVRLVVAVLRHLEAAYKVYYNLPKLHQWAGLLSSSSLTDYPSYFRVVYGENAGTFQQQQHVQIQHFGNGIGRHVPCSGGTEPIETVQHSL